MTIPKPTGLTCRHAPGWAYLTVPPKRGHAQLVEYSTDGAWHEASRSGTQWLVPVYAHGQRSDFRARYSRAGEHSAWTTGQVWAPDGFSVDDDTPPPEPPERPYNLHNRWPTASEVHLSWSQDGTVDGWHVVVVQDGQAVFDHVVGAPDVEVSGLAYTSGVEVAITAVVGEVESGPLEATWPDFHYRPTTPRSLLVVASDTSLDLEWIQDDFCEEWQVMWRPAEDGLLTSPVEAGLGNIVVAGDPAYTITGLEPGTEYSLLIAARWRRTSYSEQSLTATHATTGGGEGPRKPHLRPGRVSESSIEVLWDDDPAATGWIVRRAPGHARHRPTGVPRWYAEGLTPETAYEFGVIAVDDDHGLESAEATITITTTGTVPPPPQVPREPQQLRVHCVHATHAKAEWDANPVEDAVEHYDVKLTGASTASGEVIGTLQELRGLIPESAYTVGVRACNTAGCSPWTSKSFTTGSVAPPPEPDPPSNLAKPTGLYVDPVAPGQVEASWDQPADSRIWWLVSIDGLVHQRRVKQPHARLTASPGDQHTVEVYALLDSDSGSPTKLSAVASAGVVTARKGA